VNVGVVEFLTSGRVNANHRDFKEIGYDDCLCKLSFTSDAKDIYTHGFRLAQAYSRETLPFTNYTYVTLCAISFVEVACSSLLVALLLFFSSVMVMPRLHVQTASCISSIDVSVELRVLLPRC